MFPLFMIAWTQLSQRSLSKTKKGLSRDRMERINKMTLDFERTGAWYVGFAWQESFKQLVLYLFPVSSHWQSVLDWLVALLVCALCLLISAWFKSHAFQARHPWAFTLDDPEVSWRGVKRRFIEFIPVSCKLCGVLAVRYSSESMLRCGDDPLVDFCDNVAVTAYFLIVLVLNLFYSIFLSNRLRLKSSKAVSEEVINYAAPLMPKQPQVTLIILSFPLSLTLSLSLCCY